MSMRSQASISSLGAITQPHQQPDTSTLASSSGSPFANLHQRHHSGQHEPQQRAPAAIDFCNAFWGTGDLGVEVLLARMRGAARTIDELRTFWKERAAIEEDYAKRLSKLAKTALGRDEIGELKNSLDTVRVETDRQASAHLNLAMQVRQELETPASAFASRQTQFKRREVAVIEKEFKNKQLQEQAVAKAREKYESDCMRINSYTAQSTLIQGKELEKVQLKLDRAMQTVGANERDYANFTRALKGTVETWESDWRGFCDACQDIEEERIEFMKENIWSYANAVSTVCVADDESCEKVRVSLELIELERDMENFVRDYGTGNEIPDPPKFISYSNADAAMAASRPTPPRFAHFTRSSSRHLSMAEVLRPAPPEDEPAGPGRAGFGAGGGASARNASRERSGTMDSQNRPTSVSPVNGVAGGSIGSASRSISSPASAPLPISPDRYGPETMLAVGNNAYRVYPERDPQTALSASNAPSAAPNANVGAANDPLAKQMEDLRISAAATGGSMRRNSVNRPNYRDVDSPGPVSYAGTGTSGSGASASNLAAPGTNANQNYDYRNSAERVIGGPPPTSRPASPAAAGPPVAAHMIPPTQKPSSAVPVEDVVSSYAQALPGERRSRTPVSRATSPQPPTTAAAAHARSQSLGQNLNLQGAVAAAVAAAGIERPRSRDGFAGIGAGSRSQSPAPLVRPGSSGGMMMTSSGGRIPESLRVGSPNIGTGGAGHTSGGGHGNLGISLDERGQVTEDLMAEQYRRHQQQQQSRGIAPPPSVQPHDPYNGAVGMGVRSQFHHRQGSISAQIRSASPSAPVPRSSASPQPQHQAHPSYVVAPQSAPPAPTPVAVSAQYGTQQPPPWGYNYAQSPQYGVSPPNSAPGSSMSYSAAQAPQNDIGMGAARSNGMGAPYHMTGQSSYPNMHGDMNMGTGAPGDMGVGVQSNVGMGGGMAGMAGMAGMDTGMSMNSGMGVGMGMNSAMMRQRSPQPPHAPAPTGQYIDRHPILFYVKALYDYEAVDENEFDFQIGDVIAVTSTPEDGWWTGALLDDSRRAPGRMVFPSNFVCLF